MTGEERAARRAIRAAMERLGISAYLFALRPLDAGRWELRLDYALCSGWHHGELTIPGEELCRAAAGEERLGALTERLRAELPACPLPAG